MPNLISSNRTNKKPRFNLFCFCGILHPQPAQKYLIETHHRFTDYKIYTSSDYLLGRLTVDPQLSQKRLGDGFYEQKLISGQITGLTRQAISLPLHRL